MQDNKISDFDFDGSLYDVVPGRDNYVILSINYLFWLKIVEKAVKKVNKYGGKNFPCACQQKWNNSRYKSESKMIPNSK